MTPRYGVVAFDAQRQTISIAPSPRGELEITVVNCRYLELGQLAAPLAKNGYGQYLLGLVK